MGLGSRHQTVILEVIETALLALFLYFAGRLVIQNFRVFGPSMRPNLVDAELVLVSKLSYLRSAAQRGDVVVFRSPGNPRDDLVKRVIGLPNETVEVRDGQVFVDGWPLDGTSYITNGGHGAHPLTRVPTDSYFLMGDNRTVSEDSRAFGPVPAAAIVGKVWMVYWPPKDFGVLPKRTPTRQPVPARSEAPAQPLAVG